MLATLDRAALCLALDRSLDPKLAHHDRQEDHTRREEHLDAQHDQLRKVEQVHPHALAVRCGHALSHEDPDGEEGDGEEVREELPRAGEEAGVS